jgi:8-oxo-dGTP diphosphatase
VTYDPHAFPPFAVTVDLVILTVRDGRLHVLLVKRGEAPFKNQWALPGGFVRPHEDLRTAAVRELAEETSLVVDDVHLEQLATYGAPKRDPRMRVVSVAWLVLAADLPSPTAGTDAADASWRAVDDARAGRLAFDHAQIIGDGVERARAKLEYSSLGASFCPDEFTVAELREVYETVWGVQLDPRNFHRKVTGTPGFLVETGRTTTRGGGRPAMLYTARDAVLNPPILR